MVVCSVVQDPRKKVSTKVVFTLLSVRKVAVAGVEALWQDQKSADSIAIILKFAGVLELVGVTLKVVSPYVFNLVSFSSPLRILNISRGLPGMGFNVIRHAC
jgi:hypothetical protein